MSKLHKQIQSYLEHSASLEELDIWLADYLYELLSDPDSDSAKLTAMLRWLLIGWERGDVTEEELRRELRNSLYRNM
jgi:hypothetical protein